MGQLAKTIKTPIFPNAELQISIKDLVSGVYFVNIQNGEKMISKTFIVR